MELEDELIQMSDEKDPMLEEKEETPEKDEAPEPEEQEYTPNLQYRVGQEDREFDERVRGYITDKESEDYFRDLFSKAGGLELSKSRHTEKEKQWQQTHTDYGNLQNQWNQVKTTLENINVLKGEDFGTFQKVWEIPDSVILQRASEIVKIINDPQAQAAESRIFADRIGSLQQQQQMSQNGQYQQQLHRQLHDMKMHSAMTSPDIQKFSHEYDRRVGIQGAFQEEVNRLGSQEFSAGRYLDPQVAVSQAHARLNKLIGSFAPSPVPESQVQVDRDPNKVTRAPLPNLGSGRTGTAVQKKLKSINDLRKLANSMG